MSSYITFKEYLDSKERLREAIKETPVQLVEYTVRKYCKFPVGENKETKEYRSFKPKQILIVEWHYTDINNPTPKSIKLKDSEGEFSTYWNGKKLEKWLIRNAKENNND